MADMNEKLTDEKTEATPAAKAEKQPKAAPASPKKPNFFVRTGKRIAKFFRECVSEAKKVVWTTRPEMRKNTIWVVITVAIFSIAIGLTDTLFAEIVNKVASLLNF